MITIDIERTILSGLIFNFDTYKTALEEITVKDFENAVHAQIFSSMREYTKTNQVIDENYVLSLDEDLKAYVIGLADVLTSGLSVKYYIQEIQHRAQQKRIKNGISRIMLESEDKLSDLRKLVEEEEKRIVSDDSEQRDKQFYNVIEYLFTPEKEDERIYTGFSLLDSNLCGLKRGSISVVGARASTGKTSFAINILREQMKRNIKTLFFSLEMPVNQIYERYLSNSLLISYESMNKKKFTDNEKMRITNEISRIFKQGNLRIYDDIYTVEGIIRTIASQKPYFVIIDFIQMMKTLEKCNTNKERIDYMCGEIKRAAKTYNCHIMTLSQISREGKNAPTMSDLKESGALEENNDYVMLLHRPYVQNKEKGNETEAYLMLDKNKYGKTGKISLHFNGQYQKVSEVDSRNEK